ncbi:CwfJ C-terminus 1-domain-containing protein-like protein [Dipodascopsis uninucleata]
MAETDESGIDPLDGLISNNDPRLSDNGDKHRGRAISLESTGDLSVKTQLSSLGASSSIDQTALNRMKAAYLKAKLRKAPNTDELERRYNEALVTATGATSYEGKEQGDKTEVLSYMDTRGMFSKVASKREEDMTAEELAAHEKRSKGMPNEGRVFAEQISRDKSFKNNLDYMDENIGRLADRVKKNQIDLKNIAVQNIAKLNTILDKCQLCTSNTGGAPVVSLGTRVYLSLPPLPELTGKSASIIPIAHHRCTLDCDDDEWEEIRNFMKSLVRMYHSLDMSVIFYENAASTSPWHHASIEAIPLPEDLAEAAPAYFREAILMSDEEWSSHSKIIDTLKRAKDPKSHFPARMAFRHSLVKEMPYFHVWFTIDGGYGHVIEDSSKWPKGDLFAREIIGGMLDTGPEVINHRRLSYSRGQDSRIKNFKKVWDGYDWTMMLSEN